MSVTIRDVATAAGVSISTASRALSGRGSVNPSTLEAVELAARDLGYGANRAAQSMRSGQTKRIALIVPDLENPFFAELVKGAQARARERGYVVFVADTDDNPHVESEMVQEFAERCDGILLSTPRSSDERIIEISSMIPTVLLHRSSHVLPYILTDVARGIGLALQHLVALGHTKIAYVDGPVESWSSALRRRSLATASEAAGIEVPILGSVPAKFDGGIVGADLVLSSGVTAALTFNDAIALGMLHRLQQRGVQVPTDLSIVGFDDIAMSGMSTPQLTTIAQPLLQSGRVGVSMLLDLINGVLPPGHHQILPPQLIVRSSAGIAQARGDRK